MSSIDLAFGVWTPDKIVATANKYMSATSTPGADAMVRAGYNQLVPPKPMGNDAVAAAVLGGLAVLLGLRVGAAWYVGKQIGRPVSGAIAGGIFGAPGLGIMSLFPSEK